MNKSLRNEFGLIFAGNLVLVGLVAAGVQGLSNPIAVLRLILGLIYVLYVPGYLLQKFLFPSRIELDNIERVTLSFAFSGAIVPPIALLLDKLPWGIRLWPVVISLSIFILLCTTGIILRQAVVSAKDEDDSHGKLNLKAWWAGLEKTSRWTYIIFSLILLTATLTSISILTMPKPAAYFTEFYILGKDGMAEDYPRDITAGQIVEVITGITNREGVDATYSIIVKVGGQVIGQAGPITLNNQSTWEHPVQLTASEAGNDQQVTFILEREGHQSPYRSLSLWVNVIPAQ